MVYTWKPCISMSESAPKKSGPGHRPTRGHHSTTPHLVLLLLLSTIQREGSIVPF